MNIGETVKYIGEYGELKSGEIFGVSSDMDSYEDMKLKNGVPLYYSKKTNKYVPVKEKNIDSVFLTVKNTLGKNEFIDANGVIYTNQDPYGVDMSGVIRIRPMPLIKCIECFGMFDKVFINTDMGVSLCTECHEQNKGTGQ